MERSSSSGESEGCFCHETGLTWPTEMDECVFACPHGCRRVWAPRDGGSCSRLDVLAVSCDFEER